MKRLKFWNIPPPLEGQTVWRANTPVGTYVILKDYGEFTASYKRFPTAKRLDIISYDARVRDFAVAAEACQMHFESLQ